MPITVNDKIYNLYHFAKENEFESVVEVLSEQIFGSTSIYIPRKTKLKSNEIISIPDAYLIDMANANQPNLFVIENEIVSHDPFKHIGIQLLKFATSFDESKLLLRNFLMNIASRNPSMLKKLTEFCARSKYRNIDDFMNQIVFGDFKAIVVIDEAKTELHNVLEKINANISVIEVKAYISGKSDFLYYFDTLYDDYGGVGFDSDSKTPTSNKKNILKRLNRRAKCDTIIVPANEDGFKRVFLGENQWYAIRISAAMKDRIKYIAAYQTAPISAITYIAEIDSIHPYQNSGKYLLKFRHPAKRIKSIKLKNPRKSPQGPVYAKYDNFRKVKCVDDLLAY